MKNKMKGAIITIGIVGYSLLILGILYHNGLEKVISLFTGVILLIIRDIYLMKKVAKEEKTE